MNLDLYSNESMGNIESKKKKKKTFNPNPLIN